MRTFLSMCLLSALVGCSKPAASTQPTAASPTAVATPSELDLLQGEWQATAIDYGRPSREWDLAPASLKMNFVGSLVKVYEKERPPGYVVATPVPNEGFEDVRAINFLESDEKGSTGPKPERLGPPGTRKDGKVERSTSEPEPRWTIRALYRLDGDKLVMAMVEPEKPRPRKFEAVALPDMVPENPKDRVVSVRLITFSRVKR